MSNRDAADRLVSGDIHAGARANYRLPRRKDMRFMMIVKANASYEAGQPPDPALIAAIGKLSEKQARAGVLLHSGGLQPSSRGARVHVANGKMSVTDGPFAETKEIVGGFAILEAASKEEALRLGKEFMQVHVDVLGESYEGTLEVRPMFDPADPQCGASAGDRRGVNLETA
jgi:hypothetical protein